MKLPAVRKLIAPKIEREKKLTFYLKKSIVCG
jgi:hypothetical protein